MCIAAKSNAGVFELSVSNKGARHPSRDDAAAVPAVRPRRRSLNQQGLGLGLYIANEIARAHGGTIDVTSTANETRFTFRMPLAQASG